MRSSRPGSPVDLRRCVRPAAAALILALSAPVGGAEADPAAGSTRPHTGALQESRMWMSIGTERFDVTLDDSPTARAFVQLLPATFEMADLNGNEKHVSLPRSLPTNPVRPGTIRAGDVLLYGSDTLVVFYETFSSSYSYTRIGRIERSSGLAKALGPRSAHVTFAVP